MDKEKILTEFEKVYIDAGYENLTESEKNLIELLLNYLDKKDSNIGITPEGRIYGY